MVITLLGKTYGGSDTLPSASTGVFSNFAETFAASGGQAAIDADTRTVTERFLSNVPSYISSGQSTQDIIERIKERTMALGLLSFDTQSLIHSNLIGLGEASVDISEALNRQIEIRDAQRGGQQVFNKTIADYANEINERLSSQVVALGEGGEGFDPIKFFTDNPLLLGISAGGLAVGGIALALLLR